MILNDFKLIPTFLNEKFNLTIDHYYAYFITGKICVKKSTARFLIDSNYIVINPGYKNKLEIV